MRRSASAKAVCSLAGAQTVTAKPERLARSAMATATGLEPQITTCGRGKTGSTNMSMVPWLGHIFLAKRTPPCSSPALWPWSSSSPGGWTETSRGLPSAIASRAALSTAARAQPPPTQPSEIVPSGRITALAPALAAVAATVRTTVASANGTPADFRVETISRMSLARFIGSDLRQIGFECRQTFKIMRRREQVDIGQRRLHAARGRRIVAPADQRIEPDDLFAAPAQPTHRRGKFFGRAGVVAVGDDHHRGARVDDAPCVPAIEGGEAFADPGAAADALRHQRQLFDGARHVAVAQRRRDVRQAGVKHEGFRLAKSVDHAVQETHEERGIEAHGARGVEQHDEPQRLYLAAAPCQIEQRAAVRDIAVNSAAQVEPPAAAANLLAANEPRAHDASEPCSKRVGRGDVLGFDDVAQVGGPQRFGARGALAAAAVAGCAFAAAVGAPLDMIRQPKRFLRNVGFGEPPRRGVAGDGRA